MGTWRVTGSTRLHNLAARNILSIPWISLIKLGIYPQMSTKLAQKLHAHSVQYAHKLTSISGTYQTHTTFPLTLW
eukprot:1144254-Pelagomonas_calceolata.AAC.2